MPRSMSARSSAGVPRRSSSTNATASKPPPRMSTATFPLETIESQMLDQRWQLRQRLAELKRLRHAVIIAHNYEHDEVQEVADITGDSLQLSQAVITID